MLTSSKLPKAATQVYKKGLIAHIRRWPFDLIKGPTHGKVSLGMSVLACPPSPSVDWLHDESPGARELQREAEKVQEGGWGWGRAGKGGGVPFLTGDVMSRRITWWSTYQPWGHMCGTTWPSTSFFPLFFPRPPPPPPPPPPPHTHKHTFLLLLSLSFLFLFCSFCLSVCLPVCIFFSPQPSLFFVCSFYYALFTI